MIFPVYKLLLIVRPLTPQRDILIEFIMSFLNVYCWLSDLCVPLLTASLWPACRLCLALGVSGLPGRPPPCSATCSSTTSCTKITNWWVQHQPCLGSTVLTLSSVVKITPVCPVSAINKSRRSLIWSTKGVSVLMVWVEWQPQIFHPVIKTLIGGRKHQ